MFSSPCSLSELQAQSRQSAKLFLQSSELGLPPTPHPQASVPPPPCFWGEGNTRRRERGWESPNSDEGHTLWYSLYVRTLWLQVLVLQNSPPIPQSAIQILSFLSQQFKYSLSSVSNSNTLFPQSAILIFSIVVAASVSHSYYSPQKSRPFLKQQIYSFVYSLPTQ
jgi:hypothetical protein